MNADAFFLDCRDALIAVIFRIVGCPDTAEDLAHEAYLRFAQASGSRDIAAPRPFLYQVGRNLALDHLRKQRHRSTVAEPDDDDGSCLLERLPSALPTPEQTLDHQQQVQKMIRALAGLSERRRQILLLHKYHHWTYERIAAHFGLSRSAVEKNVRAALAHLLAAQSGED
ncbi:RNA polymerase sigma factor [Methylosarcina fibrata]|uniref:RNA polymerase sigma factor n=1 Tax=Methylosarcina fibrata TaxID=105972 RepID=UPI00036CC42A|nr:sigma-70 family RNA polymerase sigma factor [Methylosarcina fibrata]